MAKNKVQESEPVIDDNRVVGDNKAKNNTEMVDLNVAEITIIQQILQQKKQLDDNLLVVFKDTFKSRGHELTDKDNGQFSLSPDGKQLIYTENQRLMKIN